MCLIAYRMFWAQGLLFVVGVWRPVRGVLLVLYLVSDMQMMGRALTDMLYEGQERKADVDTNCAS